jgi:hypothetical protein
MQKGMNAISRRTRVSKADFGLQQVELAGQRAAVIFRRARQEYNRGLKHTSLQTALYALKLAERGGEYCRVYICGYLAQLKLEQGQSERALSYALQAIRALNPKDREYAEDVSYYRMLVEYIQQQCGQVVTSQDD